VECGKGTYIRSLAHDLGQSLGCGAHLKSLIRLSYGPFDIRAAISVPQLEDAFRHGYWQYFVHPIDTVLLHWRAIVVSDANRCAIRKGAPVVFENDDSHIVTGYPEQNSSALADTEKYCRAYTVDGHFLGVLRLNPETGQWQPEKVFL